MQIKKVSAKIILDSRKEKTIFISIATNVGELSASSPNGKSKGKNETKPYKKNIEGDIEKIKELSDYFSEDNLENFEDLRRIEDIAEGHIGANTLFALESAVLKAIAKEQKKEVWQIVNSKIQNRKKFLRLVGNCVEGGMHSHAKKKPDFQEFLLIPSTSSVQKAQETNKKIKICVKEKLRNADENFAEKKTDEDAWETFLNEKQVLEILKETKIPFGIDVAASSFYRRKIYHYKNPMLNRKQDEQFSYLTNLIENFHLFYIEDPFDEEDFENFAKLLKKFPDRIIVGDDLITTNMTRMKKAVKMKSINGVIVKPNQIGSLLEVQQICEIAKKNNIKIIFSHRSGETNETILADLAFAFGADFFKCGITGKEREVKIKRLIEIEECLK